MEIKNQLQKGELDGFAAFSGWFASAKQFTQ